MSDTTNKSIKPQTINVENLTMSAIWVDSMLYIIQDMLEEYFERYNSSDNHDVWRIAYEFNHNRARAETLWLLLMQISKDFKENEIPLFN